ncbi:MAG: 3-hydroxybutyryl-CoA dehydrogenase [Cyclobacteriaceae bacterium]|nr:3-hydroxybutyryl-CoA dehydrogenase [Cyclobacteriaceae bacterium]
MKSISVIGAGTMGNGIAHHFTLNGYPVVLHDLSSEVLQQALLTIQSNLDRQLNRGIITEKQKLAAIKHLKTSDNLEDALSSADLVIEAAYESFEAKSAIFKKLNTLAPSTALLTSNTSSISITRLAALTNRPGQVAGLHFMNPVPVMKLVEIIKGYHTLDSTIQYLEDICRQTSKSPVLVNDFPGFVSNRILMPMINEAIYTLYQGVAGVTEIDEIMKLGMAHPMGPLQLADFIGLDVCVSIMNVLKEGLGEQKYSPCPLLIQLVDAGEYGRKSGSGFYRWENGKINGISVKFK